MIVAVWPLFAVYNTLTLLYYNVIMQTLPKHSAVALTECVKRLKKSPKGSSEHKAVDAYMYIVQQGHVEYDVASDKQLKPVGDMPPHFLDALLALPERDRLVLGLDNSFQGISNFDNPTRHQLSVVPQRAAFIKEKFAADVVAAKPEHASAEEPTKRNLLGNVLAGLRKRGCVAVRD